MKLLQECNSFLSFYLLLIIGSQSSLEDIATAVEKKRQPDSGLPTSFINNPNVPATSLVQPIHHLPGTIPSQTGYQQQIPVTSYAGHQMSMANRAPAQSLQQVHKVPVHNGIQIPQFRGQYLGQPRMNVSSLPYSISTVQSAGADAHVRVPRPSPLVQSNVGVSLGGNKQPALNVQQTQPSSTQNNQKVQLAQQISELNKQHEEAQKRLEMLMSQQSNQLAGNLNSNHPVQVIKCP